MENETISYALLGGLAIALLVAAGTDLMRRKIYNWLVVLIAVAAPAWWWATGLEFWPGVAMQFGVALAAFAIGAALFAIGAMGGGDVKLLAALGLWFPPYIYLKFIVFVALIGGVLTIVFGGIHVIRRRKEKIAIPYGMAIAAAGLWMIYSEYLQTMSAGAIPV